MLKLQMQTHLQRATQDFPKNCLLESHTALIFKLVFSLSTNKNVTQCGMLNALCLAFSNKQAHLMNETKVEGPNSQQNPFEVTLGH